MTAADANPNRRAPSLTREQVAAAALDLLDREGLDGLSMRRLAAELGVGTMTLYGYFRGKEELLEAVVDVAAAQYEPPDAVGASLRDQLIAHLTAGRAWLLRHPTIVRLRGHEAIVRPGAFAVTEPLMALLLEAGLEPKEAARSFRVLFTYVFGSALFTPVTPSAEEQRALEAALLTLPEDRFPALRATAAYAGAALGGDEQFRFGLERLLDGILPR